MILDKLVDKIKTGSCSNSTSEKTSNPIDKEVSIFSSEKTYSNESQYSGDNYESKNADDEEKGFFTQLGEALDEKINKIKENDEELIENFKENPIETIKNVQKQQRQALYDNFKSSMEFYSALPETLAEEVIEIGNSLKQNLEVEYASTDGKDDGKLGFGETVKSFFKGAVNGVKESVSGVINAVKEKPLQTIGLTVATVAACVVGGPAVVAGLGVIGAVAGTVGAVKAAGNMAESFKAAKNATTDAEAKMALENAGSDTVDFVGNAVGAVTSAAGAFAAAKSMTAAKAVAGTLDDSAKLATQNLDDSARTATQNLDDSAKLATQNLDDAAKSATQNLDDTARVASQNLDDSAKAATKSLDDSLNASQKRVSQLKQKYRNGDLSKDEFTRLLENEYAKQRGLGPYRKQYPSDYSGDINSLQSAVDNPRSGVNKLNQGGWTYRQKNGGIPSEQLGQRMSLNVKGDARLIRELDDLMINGQYVDDAGNIVKVDTTDFYYKTDQDVSKWGLREDPITMYFRGDINDDTLNAIYQITKKYQRGALNGASESVPFAIVEQSPNTAMVRSLLQKAYQTNPNLGDAVASQVSARNGGRELVLSSGQYRSYLNIINEYLEAMKLAVA